MMIRLGKSLKRGNYRTKYDQTALTDAYIAVKERGLAVQRAATIYGVPITTLKDRVKGRINCETLKSGPPPLFSEEQEALLASHLDTVAKLGFGYSRIETMNLGTDYAIHLGLRKKENPLSLQWFRNFINRWPELKVTKARSLEAARAKSATRQAVDRYFAELEQILTSNNLKDRPQSIFNIDEKGLNVDHKPPKIVAGSSYKPQAITSGKSKTVTVIGGGNALGNQVPPYFVFPGKRMVDGLLDGASPGATGTVSDSGWSNTEIFEDYVQNHLAKHFPERNERCPVLVLYDGHKSHISISLIDWAKQHHVILFVLPPHCSHLLQPMDVSCYGPFETAWNAACHNYLRESGGNIITRFDVCKIACKVYSATLTPQNIQAAFKKCGIFPFNADVIPDAAVAPSTAFQLVPATNYQITVNDEDKCDAVPSTSGVTTVTESYEKASAFLEEKNAMSKVKPSKPRNTLSKVVAGKAITTDVVASKIKEHINNQKGTKRKSTNETDESDKENRRKGKSKKNQGKGKAPAKKNPIIRPIQPGNSEQEAEDSEEDDEKCVVCGKFYPTEMREIGYIKLVKWGQCEKCEKWVHLGFCCKERVLRRGDTFYCPNCSTN